MKTLDYKDADLSVRAHNQYSGSEALHIGNFQIGPSLMTAAESCPTSPSTALAHQCGNGLSAQLAALASHQRMLRCQPLGLPQV
jgi:hypothetical protein